MHRGARRCAEASSLVRYARPIAAHLDDEALVDAARGGDRAAVDQLLRRHYDRIHRICRRIAGSTRDADDACQEAMIKIARNIGRFDGRSSFGTWVYRIATNAALDELRRRARRPAIQGIDHDGETHPDEAADPLAERQVTAVEDRLAIDEALADLPEEFHVCVVLRDVADLDYNEIAEIVGVPVGTVKSRIARGRSRLAQHLRLDDLPTLPPEPADTTPADQDDDGVDVIERIPSSPPSDVATPRPGPAGNRRGVRERPTDST